SRLLSQAARDADAIVVSDYGAGTVGEECHVVLRSLAAKGMPVCVDSRYSLHRLTGLTICKPNEPELQSLTRISIQSDRDLLKAGRMAIRLLDCQSLLVTRGRNGMAIFDRTGKAELIPIHGPEDAVDVTGAGDTVIAALALSLGAGATVLQAAQIANIAGGWVVKKKGTATVSQAELQRELRQPNGGAPRGTSFCWIGWRRKSTKSGAPGAGSPWPMGSSTSSTSGICDTSRRRELSPMCWWWR